MAFRIKTISPIQGKHKNQRTVTVEEVSALGDPTGREHTEKTTTIGGIDWVRLKDKFEGYFKDADAEAEVIETLLTEADNAKLTQLNLS